MARDANGRCTICKGFKNGGLPYGHSCGCPMTPEEIVGMIGNIANRPDLRDTQEQQVDEIKRLVDVYKNAYETILWLCENVADFRNGNTCQHGIIDEGVVNAANYINDVKKSLEVLK